MPGIITRNGRRTIWVGSGDDRKYVALGRATAKQADAVLVKVRDLERSSRLGVDPQPGTLDWAGKLPDDLHGKLVDVGLVGPRAAAQRVPTVREWVAGYIAGRTDAKPNTISNMRQAEKSLAEHLGDKRLDDVTEADADGFRVFLKDKKLAEATINRRCKRAKQFFRAAVKAKRLKENPFAGLKCGASTNRGRFYFVTREEADQVIAKCPDAEWRLLFALCRWGGLRCPSEVLRLTWSDVLWDRDRITVHASKTAHHDGGGVRHVPIFTELRPHLEAAFEQAEPGAVHCITRYRDTNQNLRTQFGRIIERAGLVPWPKLFQNLRATRETELAEQYPLHVVTEWLGNSTQIAAKHYLQVTDDHFRRAAQAQPNTADSVFHGVSRPKGPRGGRDTKSGTINRLRNKAGQHVSADPQRTTPKGGRTIGRFSGKFAQSGQKRCRIRCV